MAARPPAALGPRAQLTSGGLFTRRGWIGDLVAEVLDMALERLIAFRDALLIRVVQRHLLLQDKEEVRLPRAFEALGDGVPTRVNPGMAQGGEGLRIAFTGEDRAHD